jgi:hypothetical protein
MPVIALHAPGFAPKAGPQEEKMYLKKEAGSFLHISLDFFEFGIFNIVFY